MSRPEPDCEGFGYWLRREMDRADISMFELAFHCGLGESTIYYYKSGKSTPVFLHAIFLCNSIAKLQNHRMMMGLSRSEIQLLSDKMLIEISRTI